MAEKKEPKALKEPKSKLYVSKVQVARCVPRLKVNRVFDPSKHNTPTGKLTGMIPRLVAEKNVRPASKGMKVGDFDEFDPTK